MKPLNPRSASSFRLQFGGGVVLLIWAAGIHYKMRKASGHVPPPHNKKHPRPSRGNPNIVIVDMSNYSSSKDDGDDTHCSRVTQGGLALVAATDLVMASAIIITLFITVTVTGSRQTSTPRTRPTMILRTLPSTTLRTRPTMTPRRPRVLIVLRLLLVTVTDTHTGP